MRRFDLFILSLTAPEEGNVLWIDTSLDPPTIKVFTNGEWEPVVVNGKSAYEMYLDITADNPPLTLEQFTLVLTNTASILNEQYAGKTAIATSLSTKGVPATGTDTFQLLSNKVMEVKDIQVINPPLAGVGDFAENIVNTILENQDILDIYDSVFAQYCSEGKAYVGALLTTVHVSATNTSIVLKGADAYYIAEEGKFYNANTTHIWQENLYNLRNVFYLYLPNSTADGVRELVHNVQYMYCKNSNIPNIYISNCLFVYLHITNIFNVKIEVVAQLTNLIYLYTNAAVTNNTGFFLQAAISLLFLDIKNLSRWDTNVFWGHVNSSMIKNFKLKYITLPSLTSITGGYLLYNSTLQLLTLPSLTSITGGYLLSNSTLQLLTLPSLTSFTGGYLLSNSTVHELTLPSLTSITGGYLLYYSTVQELTLPSLTEVNVVYKDSFNSALYSSNIEFLHVENLERLYINAAHNSALLGGISVLKELFLPNLRFWHTQTIGSDTKALLWACPDVERVVLGKVEEYSGLVPLLAVGASNITDVELGEGWDINFRFGTAQSLTAFNIVNHILTRLKDNTGLTKKTLTLGAVNLAKLTAEEIAIATDKNWTLA